MRIGAIFPQTEIGSRASDIRLFGESVDKLGFQHIGIFDHVVGADPSVHKGWSGPYHVDTEFHEPFVLFGFLAATTSLELVTEIVILPQRQTVLVAKQAAEVDLLTDGKFRLGVGIGWNAVEYEALGEDFTARGRRLEEQVGLLRQLWTERSITMTGSFDRVSGAGIAPLPTQRPIPIWMGGGSAKTLDRMGRLADGWFPQMQPGPELNAAIEVIADAATDAGRDPSDVAMEGRVTWRGDLGMTIAAIDEWRSAGATHVSINTMGADLTTVQRHVGALAEIASELGLN